jgi:hypothetical protein
MIERMVGTKWVLLSYRLPREPSTPRISLWRRLKRLGVLQLGDGLVALPRNPVTEEALDWAANEVIEQGGEATVWVAEPSWAVDRKLLEKRFAEGVADQYRLLAQKARRAATGSRGGRRRTLAALRKEMARIRSQDHLGAVGRFEAEAALGSLTRLLDRSA